MFWSKLCKSTETVHGTLRFLFTYCLEYVWKSSLWIGIFQRAEWVHNVQECYWPTIYRAGAAVVSTIISCKSFSCVFRICTRAISILSILAFLMTVDPRNKLRWSYYRCKWVKSRFSRCNWDARGISKEMHESSTTVCTATSLRSCPLPIIPLCLLFFPLSSRRNKEAKKKNAWSQVIPLQVLLIVLHKDIGVISWWRPAKRGRYLVIDDKMTVDKTNINKAYQSLGILKLWNFKHWVRGPNNCKVSAKSNLRITVPSLDILMPIEFSCTL